MREKAKFLAQKKFLELKIDQIIKENNSLINEKDNQIDNLVYRIFNYIYFINFLGK